MRRLLDQDVYAATFRFLVAQGHDVVPASAVGMSRAEDEVLLKFAADQNRILLTRDRDFGVLVFLKSAGSGVVYLRVLPSTLDSVHAELQRVLSLYAELELGRSFVVVEPDGHRIRRLPAI
jgi:predicted nuclease of predicted toxin-antitoxin system